MDFNLTELRGWVELIGVGSLVALVGVAIKVWRWLTNPLRKKIVQLSRRFNIVEKQFGKESFDLRTKLTEYLRKFMDLEHRIDKAVGAMKHIEETLEEETEAMRSEIVGCREDFEGIRDTIIDLKDDLGTRISTIEGEMRFIREALKGMK